MTSVAWYNEIDTQKAAWLRELITKGVGIGFNGHRFTSDVAIGERERYQGRNLRDAIDMAMNAQHEDGAEA